MDAATLRFLYMALFGFNSVEIVRFWANYECILLGNKNSWKLYLLVLIFLINLLPSLFLKFHIYIGLINVKACLHSLKILSISKSKSYYHITRPISTSIMNDPYLLVDLNADDMSTQSTVRE